MFTRLAAAGAQIVVNDVAPARPRRAVPRRPRSTGARTSSAAPTIASSTSIDGAVAWTGGAGIEDHFDDGGFHDVMVRVTGDVVRQAQAAFLTSFRGHGGPLPGDLVRATSPRRPTRARRRSRSRR